jgi:hypothetical protein
MCFELNRWQIRINQKLAIGYQLLFKSSGNIC